MTEWCWGFGWGDDCIDAKTRSMMNLTMIGALGKMHEWEIHCRGAIGNGVTKEQLRAIIQVIAIYCGVPQSLECSAWRKRLWRSWGWSDLGNYDLSSQKRQGRRWHFSGSSRHS